MAGFTLPFSASLAYPHNFPGIRWITMKYWRKKSGVLLWDEIRTAKDGNRTWNSGHKKNLPPGNLMWVFALQLQFCDWFRKYVKGKLCMQERSRRRKRFEGLKERLNEESWYSSMMNSVQYRYVICSYFSFSNGGLWIGSFVPSLQFDYPLFSVISQMLHTNSHFCDSKTS